MADMMRGANVSLTREVPNLRSIVVGVNWDATGASTLGANLTMAAILCDDTGKAGQAENFVYFNQIVSADLSTERLSKALGGDDEQIEVDLDVVPASVHKIVFVLYANEGIGAARTLGRLRSCRVRVLNLAGDASLVRSEDLASHMSEETASILSEVYRHGDGWKFKVIGQGYANGLAGVARDYGVPL